MFEEEALLYAKDGQHSPALKIIIHQMKELSRAEQYCDKYYATKDGREVYLELFKVLIEATPDQDEMTINLHSAVDLLTRHSDKIDVGMALELLPKDISLPQLEPPKLP